jgi:hypothetical protein
VLAPFRLAHEADRAEQQQIVDGGDQLGLLRDRQVILGPQIAAVGRADAGEDVEIAHLALGQADDGLKEHVDPVAVQRVAHHLEDRRLVADHPLRHGGLARHRRGGFRVGRRGRDMIDQRAQKADLRQHVGKVGLFLAHPSAQDDQLVVQKLQHLPVHHQAVAEGGVAQAPVHDLVHQRADQQNDSGPHDRDDTARPGDEARERHANDQGENDGDQGGGDVGEDGHARTGCDGSSCDGSREGIGDCADFPRLRVSGPVRS